ncbi:hypothetical protein PCC6912_32930 [Chlorogloeopsis fritschii PCC 6912]|uniref:Uncharacterized protein n=2 Tax=Chlorogloeopsis fritschii TaxID=1124 RepID=A0A3S0ZM73_CHLFR|nr:hypothetical protein PCC6912_32930 [Chlorogloeopsis fritschii PCC 6912]
MGEIIMTDQVSTANVEQFYYADGKRIPLTPSHHFVAVRTEAHNGEARMQTANLAQALSAVTSVGEVFEIPDYDLMVVKVAETPTPRTTAIAPPIETVNSFVNTQPELTVGPPVYEVPQAPVTEGLIPVGEILVKFKANVQEELKQQLLRENNLEIRQSNYPEPGTDLVTAPNSQQTVAIANKLHESNLVEYAQPNFVRLAPRLGAGNGYGSAVLSRRDLASQSAGVTAKEVQQKPETATRPLPTAPPTDPGFVYQWGLIKIKAPEAFDISMGSPSISIAIIDEGCDIHHEDIVYKQPGYDAVYRRDDPSPLPRDGHGTSCAGIAAAKANNNLGGAGVAPDCQVLPIRIAYGVGGGWYTSDAIIADGVRTAVNRGADVLSNSWGGGSPSTVITNAFKYAQTDGRGGKGCPIAIATANNDVYGVAYPANLSPTIPGLMAVGASNQWDQRKSKTSLDGEYWWGSNYGPEVDVVAPGVKIYTTDIMGTGGYGGGNYIPDFNGTSSATPHVAGLMGLILSVDPDLRSWEVEDIIKLTVDDLGPVGRDDEFGFGRINCRRALEATSRVWYEISVEPEFIGAGNECFIRINLRMYNSGINTVRLDGLNLISHSPDWNTEIDRFEYRPNPGGIMVPRADHDLRFNQILLKANGNQSSWSYSWSMNWWYTYWRPNSPGLPMSVGELTEAAGVKVMATTVRGSGAFVQPSQPKEAVLGNTLLDNTAVMLNSNGQVGESLVIDLQNKTITIALR